MWRLAENWAYLESLPLAAKIELARPDRGLVQIAVEGQSPGAARLLGVELTGTATPTFRESHVRRNELIANYASDPARAIEVQITWRAIIDGSPAIGGIEAIISVQTELLDSDPGIMIGSRVAADEVFHMVTSENGEAFRPLENSAGQRLCVEHDAASGTILYRLSSLAYSYLEMIHPSDFVQCELGCDGPAKEMLSSKFRLFCERLEKGVIRRARVRGLLFPRQNDLETARACCQQFLDSAIPLGAY